MINSLLSQWLGITFVLIGAINVWLILQSSAKLKSIKASRRLIAAHRIGGYLFIALFCVMAYFTVSRLGDVSGGASPGPIIHPFSCRQGQCGTCKTKLLAGNVRMASEAGLDLDSRAQGFVLTCVGRANGAVRLDI